MEPKRHPEATSLLFLALRDSPTEDLNEEDEDWEPDEEENEMLGNQRIVAPNHNYLQ